jgi:hypothetical protein
MIKKIVNARYFTVAWKALVAFLVISLIYFAHHKRIESFYYRWYPDNTYPPAKQFPDVVKGSPKVVLVRKVGSLECFEIYYSSELDALLKNDPARLIKIKYRVSVRFGRAYWIETLETEGTPYIMGTGGQRGRGQCF